MPKLSIYVDDKTALLIDNEIRVGESMSKCICRLIRQGSKYIITTKIEVVEKDA